MAIGGESVSGVEFTEDVKLRWFGDMQAEKATVWIRSFLLILEEHDMA